MIKLSIGVVLMLSMLAISFIAAQVIILLTIATMRKARMDLSNAIDATVDLVNNELLRIEEKYASKETTTESVPRPDRTRIRQPHIKYHRSRPKSR